VEIVTFIDGEFGALKRKFIERNAKGLLSLGGNRLLVNLFLKGITQGLQLVGE